MPYPLLSSSTSRNPSYKNSIHNPKTMYNTQCNTNYSTTKVTTPLSINRKMVNLQYIHKMLRTDMDSSRDSAFFFLFQYKKIYIQIMLKCKIKKWKNIQDTFYFWRAKWWRTSIFYFMFVSEYFMIYTACII